MRASDGEEEALSDCDDDRLDGSDLGSLIAPPDGVWFEQLGEQVARLQNHALPRTARGRIRVRVRAVVVKWAVADSADPKQIDIQDLRQERRVGRARR